MLGIGEDDFLNNRAVATATASIVQRTQYYPFGLPFGDAQGRDLQPYTYNGKQNDSRLQLNLMDYVARQNNNTYGRFTSMDPLAEKYFSWSPYAYCANNPLKFVDPDGMDVYILHNGQLLRIPVKDSTNDYILFSNTETNRIDILTVNDQSILKNFTSGDPSHAITSNADDAFNIFKFMADNTPNEWGLDGNKDGTYTLRTDYNTGEINPHGKKYLIGLSFQFFKNN